MRRKSRFPILALAVWALLSATCVPGKAATAKAPRSRVLAVGDVHANAVGLRQILTEAGLLEKQRWVGRDAVLVQTGDLLDRGPDIREVLDLLISLQSQARKQGGEVLVLLGNHEAMNLLVMYQDVSPAAFASFADARSESRRQQAYSSLAEFQKNSESKISKEDWLAAHPAGFLAYQEAFGPAGSYGQWLRTLPVLVVVEATAFVHGGLSASLLAKGLDGINQAVRAEIARYDRLRKVLVDAGLILPFFSFEQVVQTVRTILSGSATLPVSKAVLAVVLEWNQSLADSLLLSPQGPLWYRGYARDSPEQLNTYLPEILKTIRARRVVVGHSPRKKGRIEARAEHRVFLIDTGMQSKVYLGGRASALEIRGERIRAIYTGEQEVLFPPPIKTENQAAEAERRWPGADGQPLPFVTDSQMLEFLRQAEVIDTEKIDAGITKPKKLTLARDGLRAHAIFRYGDQEVGKQIGGMTSRRDVIKDSCLHELAAFALSRLLGMENVPPVIKRRHRGKLGSVQVWIEQTMTNGERKEKGIHPPDTLRWQKQMADLRVFDNLVHNTDRNLGNLLIDQNWKVWLIDHTRTFGQATRLLHPDRIKRCSRALWHALIALERKQVAASLGVHISPLAIDALMQRRDEVLRLIRARIDKAGEKFVLF